MKFDFVRQGIFLFFLIGIIKINEIKSHQINKRIFSLFQRGKKEIYQRKEEIFQRNNLERKREKNQEEEEEEKENEKEEDRKRKEKIENKINFLENIFELNFQIKNEIINLNINLLLQRILENWNGNKEIQITSQGLVITNLLFHSFILRFLLIFYCY